MTTFEFVRKEGDLTLFRWSGATQQSAVFGLLEDEARGQQNTLTLKAFWEGDTASAIVIAPSEPLGDLSGWASYIGYSAQSEDNMIAWLEAPLTAAPTQPDADFRSLGVNRKTNQLNTQSGFNLGVLQVIVEGTFTSSPAMATWDYEAATLSLTDAYFYAVRLDDKQKEASISPSASITMCLDGNEAGALVFRLVAQDAYPLFDLLGDPPPPGQPLSELRPAPEIRFFHPGGKLSFPMAEPIYVAKTLTADVSLNPSLPFSASQTFFKPDPSQKAMQDLFTCNTVVQTNGNHATLVPANGFGFHLAATPKYYNGRRYFYPAPFGPMTVRTDTAIKLILMCGLSGLEYLELQNGDEVCLVPGQNAYAAGFVAPLTLLFAIQVDADSLQKMINALNAGGAPSSDLFAQFKTNQRALYQSATIEVTMIGSEWTVSQGTLGPSYLIKNAGQELNVFIPPPSGGSPAAGGGDEDAVLSDLGQTSWLSVQTTGTAYYSQAGAEPFFAANVFDPKVIMPYPCAVASYLGDPSPVAGGVRAFPIAPHSAVYDASNSNSGIALDVFTAFESQVLVHHRYGVLVPPNTVPVFKDHGGSPLVGGGAATPTGFIANLHSGAAQAVRDAGASPQRSAVDAPPPAGTWSSLTLASHTENGTEQTLLFDTPVCPNLIQGLLHSNVFLVANNWDPAVLGTLTGELLVDGFAFRANPVQPPNSSPPPADAAGTIVVFKYQTTASLETLVGTPNAWFNPNSLDSTAITAISAVDPTVITSAKRGLSTGDTILIAGSDSTPVIDGQRTVTILDANTFTVPVAVTTAGTKGTWTPANPFLVAIPSDSTPDSTPVEDVQKAIRNAITVADASIGTIADPFGYFRDTIARDQNWTGVVFFHVPIDGNNMPPDLQILFAGIDGQLYAHHFGIDLNHLTIDKTSGNPQLTESSLFGVIQYQGTPLAANPAPPAPGWDAYAFTVLDLTVAIENSVVTDFDAEVAMRIPKIFGRQVSFADPDLFADPDVGRAITIISPDNPTVITSAKHGLSNGDTIIIAGSDSVPPIDGQQIVTKLTADTFTIPIAVTTPGTKGTWINLNLANTLGIKGVYQKQGNAQGSSGTVSFQRKDPLPIPAVTDGGLLRVVDEFHVTSAVLTPVASPKQTEITGISAANRTVITSVKHGLSNGDTIIIDGSNSVPVIDGQQVVANVMTDTFTVAVAVTTAGTTGTWTKGFPITGISAANPTVITSAKHGLSTEDTIVIVGSDSTPTIDGHCIVTVLTPDTFTIPVAVTTPGTKGAWKGTMEARFSLGGQLWFSPNPFGVADPADLFSFGNPSKTTGLDLDDLGLMISFGLDADGKRKGDTTIDTDYSHVQVSQDPDGLRPGSLLASFPMKVTGFLHDDKGLTPGSLAASPMNVVNIKGNDASAPTFALECDLPLGSMGFLAGAHADISSKLVLAWGPSSATPDNDAAQVLVRLLNLSANVGSFDLQGIIQVGFKDANLVRVSKTTGVQIRAISADNPTMITSSTSGLADGDKIDIVGSDSAPSIDGQWAVSEVTADTFQIAVGVTKSGTTGTWTRSSDDVYVALFNNVALKLLGITFPPNVLANFLLMAGTEDPAHQNVAWYLAAAQSGGANGGDKQ